MASTYSNYTCNMSVGKLTSATCDQLNVSRTLERQQRRLECSRCCSSRCQQQQQQQQRCPQLSTMFLLFLLSVGCLAPVNANSDLQPPGVPGMPGAGLPGPGGYRSRFGGGGHCEKITIPLCLDMKYNMTRMPNLVGQMTQSEAAMQVHEFVPLVQFGCSRLLKFFLCSLYAPMCTVQVDEPMVIPACRSMCLEVRARCEPVLLRFNFNWPAVLDCAQLPERSDRSNLCIDPPPAGEDDTPDADMENYGASSSGKVVQNPEWAKLLDAFRGGRSSTARQQSTTPSGLSNQHHQLRTGSCSDRFVLIAGQRPDNVSVTSPTVTSLSRGMTCAARCGVDVLYASTDKQFISTWMTVWATLCLVSSLFAALTFVVDSARFDYPERPILFLSLCYCFYACAFLVRAGAGAQTISCDHTRDTGELYVIREGLESVWCMAVFLVLYYFGMASSAWWVVLSVSWFLASARRWGREAIQACAGYFHLVAWTLPAVQTIVALAIRRVDGDELTGLCYVGNQDSVALAGFVIAPTCVYLSVGVVFIVVGFLSLVGVRHDLKHPDYMSAVSPVSGSGAGSADVRRLERLMAKIGAFSVIYVVSTCCLLAALFYQQHNTDSWLKQAAQTPCRSYTAVTDGDKRRQSCSLDSSIPSVAVQSMKLAASLLVGVASGLWVLSTKTLISWRRLVCRLCDRRQTSRTVDRRLAPAAGRLLTGTVGRQDSVGTGRTIVPLDRSLGQQQQQQQQQQPRRGFAATSYAVLM